MFLTLMLLLEMQLHPKGRVCSFKLQCGEGGLGFRGLGFRV